MSKRPPTPKQRAAAKAVTENAIAAKPKPLGEVLENVGYGTIVQDPKRIVESVGFKSALRELGLTEELITTSLVSDIEAKPERRLGELKLGAEMLQMVRNEDKPVSESKNTYNFIFSPEVQTRVHEINEDIKKILIKDVQKDKNNLESQ